MQPRFTIALFWCTQYSSNRLSNLRLIIKLNDSPQGSADSLGIANLRRLEHGID